MKSFLTPLACGTFLVALAAIPACAAPQQQSQTSQQSQPPAQTGQQTQSSSPAQPNSTAPTASTAQSGSTTQQKQAPVNSSVPPPPPPPDQTAPAAQTGAQKTAQPGNDAPLPQQDAPNVKPGSKQDVNAIGDRNVGKGGIDFYSIEHEIALGKQLAQEVERTSKLVDDPVIVEYVNRVGQNLVRNSDAKVPFTIKVIDSDEINAFALPGGFFYVNSGLILRASEESELAGVMAHEIAHVAARHGTKNASKAELMQLATIPLILLGPAGMAGYGIYEASQFAIPMGYLKFSRDSEREADYLGLQYMYKTGYDPNAYVTFFEKILAEEKRRPGSIPKIFSTHPPTPERIQNAQKEIETILPSRPDYIVTTSEFDTVKARLYAYEHRNKIKDGGPGKPTLRSKTEQKTGQTGTGTGTQGTDDGAPTLKKRTDGNNGSNNGSNNN